MVDQVLSSVLATQPLHNGTVVLVIAHQLLHTAVAGSHSVAGLSIHGLTRHHNSSGLGQHSACKEPAKEAQYRGAALIALC